MKYLACLCLALVCCGCSEHMVNVGENRRMSLSDLESSGWKEAEDYWKDGQLSIKVVTAQEIRAQNNDILMVLNVSIENSDKTRRFSYRSGWQDNSSKYDEFNNHYDARVGGFFLSGAMPDENGWVYPDKTKLITLIFDSPVKSAKELRLTLPGANLELDHDVCLKFGLEWRSKFAKWPPLDKALSTAETALAHNTPPAQPNPTVPASPAVYPSMTGQTRPANRPPVVSPPGQFVVKDLAAPPVSQKVAEENPAVPADSFREWRGKNGKTVKANLIDMQGEFINLQGEQRKYKVRLSDLSKDDQYYILQEEMNKDLRALADEHQGTSISKTVSLQKAVVDLKQKFDGRPLKIVYPIVDVLESKKQNVYLVQLGRPEQWATPFTPLMANEITLAMNQDDALIIEPHVSLVCIEALLSVKTTDCLFLPFIEANRPIYLVNHPSFVLAFAFQQPKVTVKCKTAEFEAKISKDFAYPKPIEKPSALNDERRRLAAEKSVQARHNIMNRINQRRADDADTVRRQYLQNAARMKANQNSTAPRFNH